MNDKIFAEQFPSFILSPIGGVISDRYSYASYEYKTICDIFYDGEDYNEDEIISKLKNVGFYIKLGVMF